MTTGADDKEFAAMIAVYQALEPLDDDARGRVMDYVVARLDISVNKAVSAPPVEIAPVQEEAIQKEQTLAPKFETFADLANAAGAATHADKALVAGYWLQVCSSADSFDGFSANRELKNLGDGIANITMALDALRNQTPALALQLRKSGKSRQARKTYKLTVAGIKAVETMIAANSA